MNFRYFLGFGALIFISSFNQVSRAEKPNLVIIHTDEHNFRTLGSYRSLLSEDQAFVWGKGVEVPTPNIDRLANEGALCMHYYASSPVCTPSRASFVSGLYPVATRSVSNNIPMKDEVVTFAEVLRKQGYATSYVGKWHLDGDAKPGFAPERKFGFDDNKYMFNRGHWKLLQEVDGKPELVGEFNEETQNVKVNIKDADEKSFTTDFLTDRVLDIIRRDKDGPFCLMLSLPDPHTPNTVRAPYDTLFNHLEFQRPRTMIVPEATLPGWAEYGGKSSAKELEQQKMRGYFGMVSCIDDNVGRILACLEEYGLEENTIVVFTSDHGDMMGEHMKHNKGLPYETSAKIPFLIRYPEKIKPGIVIRKAYTTVDFTPTILGLMDAPQIDGSQGLNAADDFTETSKELIDSRVVYITNSGSAWVCAVNNHYKLVLSQKDVPWLFDMEKDPDELFNYYNEPGYEQIVADLQKELFRQMKVYKDPALAREVKFIVE